MCMQSEAVVGEDNEDTDRLLEQAENIKVEAVLLDPEIDHIHTGTEGQ